MLAGRTHQVHDVTPDFLPPRTTAAYGLLHPWTKSAAWTTPCRPLQRVGAAGGRKAIFLLGLGVRVSEVHADQEAVELRLGQRIRAVELNRVLRGDHHEECGQHVPHALDRHLLLGHRLKQARLRARAGAVDLVGQEDIREDRALAEGEGSLTRVVNRAAEDVGRQQVRCELHAAELGVDAARQGLGECCLAQAGEVFDQDVPLGQQGAEQQADAVVLALDDGAEVGPDVPQAVEGRDLGSKLPRDVPEAVRGAIPGAGLGAGWFPRGGSTLARSAYLGMR